MISPSVIKKSAVSVKQCHEKFCNPHTGIMTRARAHTHDDTRRWRTIVQVRRLHAVNQLKQRTYVYTYVRVFSFFVEATGITEKSSKRAAVSELKSFSDGISGRSSPREVSEMPVLTRVCSPATLPRLKKFRFRPIDGKSCLLLNL